MACSFKGFKVYLRKIVHTCQVNDMHSCHLQGSRQRLMITLHDIDLHDTCCFTAKGHLRRTLCALL